MKEYSENTSMLGKTLLIFVGMQCFSYYRLYGPS